MKQERTGKYRERQEHSLAKKQLGKLFEDIGKKRAKK